MSAVEIITTMSLHDGILYSLHYHKLLGFTLISLLLISSVVFLAQSLPELEKAFQLRKKKTKVELAQSIQLVTVVTFSMGIALLLLVSYTCITYIVTLDSYKL